jgi:hypothetical protein
MVVCRCEEVRLETGPTESGDPRRGRARRRPLRRSLTEDRWSSAAAKKSGWKPDLQSRESLVGRERGGALCAGVSRRIDGRLPLRRSPVGNRTYRVGSPSSGESAALPFAPESHGESMVARGAAGRDGWPQPSGRAAGPHRAISRLIRARRRRRGNHSPRSNPIRST